MRLYLVYHTLNILFSVVGYDTFGHMAAPNIIADTKGQPLASVSIIQLKQTTGISMQWPLAGALVPTTAGNSRRRTVSTLFLQISVGYYSKLLVAITFQ